MKEEGESWEGEEGRKGPDPSPSPPPALQPDVLREKLLSDLKRQVKQIMEEATVKRFIHEDSSLVASLCAAVEACLAHGLKGRVLGLFGSSSTFALIHKISKLCPPAASVLRILLKTQQQQMKKRNSEAGGSFDILKAANSLRGVPQVRYLWIRIALFEKLLPTIIDHIARHSSKYYSKDALMSDPVRGVMVANLLVGPCALEYSKVKTLDHYWTDPPANELVQRQLLHSPASSVSPGPRSPRPSLQVRRTGSMSAEESLARLPSSARDYVLSLHQNTKSTLLYGKNNVSVCSGEGQNLLKGYLSLHQNPNGTLSIKWTPNELMHSESLPQGQVIQDKNTLWRYALNINVDEIVYLHFHQKGDSGGTVVFVGADGIQHPPIHFPSGQHPLAFLSCLENGLLPWGQLDPPLWLQRGKGKVLPKLRRRSVKGGELANGKGVLRRQDSTHEGDEEKEEETEKTLDYVFRVIPLTRPEESGSGTETPSPGSHLTQMANGSVNSRLVALSSLSNRLKGRFMSLSSSPTSSPPPTPKTGGSSVGDEEEISQPGHLPPLLPPSPHDHNPVEKRLSEPTFQLQQRTEKNSLEREGTLRSACDSMRYQILSRAFYGWLAYCRHLKTIRTHLSNLTHPKAPEMPPGSRLTTDDWKRLQANRHEAESEVEFFRLVYAGGMDPALRVEVWPYLLGLTPWTAETDDVMAPLRISYETLITEWVAVEAIVRQRDKEIFQAARCSKSEGNAPPVPEDKEPLNNEVFEDSSEVPDGGETRNDEDGRRTPEEGDGGVYSKELVETFALNLHRIEKDVMRCDRNHPYFVPENLDKLKNVMCTYVWERLDSGYIQGMCDLAAPFLVLFDDEVMAYGCFCKLMERMTWNFPHGGGMDVHLANMRALIQVMDPELFEFMRSNGDYTHFYFCYRWFLLDFKREFQYKDVYLVWEIIWSSRSVASGNFILFLALAFLLMYRDIILDNNMDFTDIIKFYNEMAEKHDVKVALDIARKQVTKLQTLIESDE